jgi:hypothetical protein
MYSCSLISILSSLRSCERGNLATSSTLPFNKSLCNPYLCLEATPTRTYLKNRILVQDRGGAEFQTAGNLWVVEDLKRGTNPAEKGGKPKDIFEIASNLIPAVMSIPITT